MPAMISASAAFRIAYGRDPSASELERAAQIGAGREPRPAIQQLRTITSGFDRQTHPTPITVRFTQDDLAIVNLGRFRLVTDRRDIAVGVDIGPKTPWEPHLTDFMMRSIKPGMTVLDIGANIGYFSMLCASLVGREGSVLSFEPNTENCRLIMLSAIENQFSNIYLFPVALSNVNGTACFSPAIGSNGAMLPKARETVLNPNCIVVPTMRLDDIIGDRTVDYIKADVEGAEYIALSGASQIIRKRRPIITSEFSLEMLGRISGIQGADYLRWIESHGYKLFVINSDGSGLSAIGDIDRFLGEWGSVSRIGDLAFLPEGVPMTDQLYPGASDIAERGFVLEATQVQPYGREESPTLALPAAAPEEQGEDAARLFHLRRFATVAGKARFLGDRLEVTTAPEQWAYTAVIPIDRAMAPQGSIVRFSFAIEVDRGTLQAGILNQAETDFIATATLGAGPLQTVELAIPFFDRVGRMVLRNGSADGSSHGWCRLLGVTIETPP